jgi:hypothetical protein
MLENKKKKPKCIIYHYEGWLFWWDFLIIMLAICFTVVSPLEVAFSPPFTCSRIYVIADLTTYCLFAIDIIIKFMTTYNKEDGGIETSHRQIAKHYLSSNFFFDIIPSVPWVYIFGDFQFLKLFSLFRILHAFRLKPMINKL